jgi:hypothetical protein
MGTLIIEKECWVIMSKDRKWIAKGIPRNRYLVKIDSSDNKRILTYTHKKVAEQAFLSCGFYGGWGTQKDMRENLEAVKCKFIIKEINEQANPDNT